MIYGYDPYNSVDSHPLAVQGWAVIVGETTIMDRGYRMSPAVTLLFAHKQHGAGAIYLNPPSEPIWRPL